ncbi:MAG: hypothetical protein PHU88_05695 [candidate division Zixibacteria bacterium]|nr:hypothetical protein [candidate division Zixibacteria bacterium]MDD5427500.1 hypothetical protein [candidate division Zixibacteria bacterium]
MNGLKKNIIILILVTFIAGCSSNYRTGNITEGKKAAGTVKIDAEAYLFDAKIRREGKVNSFRLEIFQTDSLLGLGGRAYLGKGALKGRLSADSLWLYFPAQKEYVRDAAAVFFKGQKCPLALTGVNILDIFKERPDSIALEEGIKVTADLYDEERPHFRITSADCPWQIDLIYDLKETGWRIKEFTFSDGEKLKIEATCREYKATARVKPEKFQVVIPPASIRIEL